MQGVASTVGELEIFQNGSFSLPLAGCVALVTHFTTEESAGELAPYYKMTPRYNIIVFSGDTMQRTFCVNDCNAILFREYV